MYYFAADHHFGHSGILIHCKRPFDTVEEMNEELIARHNEVVKPSDVVIYAGDFAWVNNKEQAVKYIKRLNGSPVFLKGSHDGWLPSSAKYIWRKRLDGKLIVVCHYAMRTWEGSHYGSWNLHGHSHGRLEPIANQLDIGVDCHDFYPYSLDELKVIMTNR